MDPAEELALLGLAIDQQTAGMARGSRPRHIQESAAPVLALHTTAPMTAPQPQPMRDRYGDEIGYEVIRLSLAQFTELVGVDERRLIGVRVNRSKREVELLLEPD